MYLLDLLDKVIYNLFTIIPLLVLVLIGVFLKFRSIKTTRILLYNAVLLSLVCGVLLWLQNTWAWNRYISHNLFIFVLQTVSVVFGFIIPSITKKKWIYITFILLNLLSALLFLGANAFGHT